MNGVSIELEYFTNLQVIDRYLQNDQIAQEEQRDGQMDWGLSPEIG